MVFDTRTLQSLSALADVVGEYTAPGRSRVELTDQQKRDACMLRYLHGWHADHIVEALGIANANYAFNWRENVVEALEDCAASDYWNGQQIRLSPGIQISAEGTNEYGAARTTALRNAVAQVLIANPAQRNAAEKTKSQRRGEDIPGTSLMDKAFAIIDRQIADGSFRGERPREPGRQNINRYIRDLEALGFVWEGAGRTQIMASMPDGLRILVDQEIQRQCQAQIDAGGAEIQRGERIRLAPLNYSLIARNVYNNLVVDERFGAKLGDLGYPPIQVGYVRDVCQQAGITTDIRRTLAEQIADEDNLALVVEEKRKDPLASAWQVHQRSGLQHPVVEGIFDRLGYPRAGRELRRRDIRNMIFQAHDEGKTVDEILANSEVLREYYKDNVLGPEEAVLGVLRRAGKTPHTKETIEITLREERRAPLVAANIKATLIAWLNDLKEQRSFGRLYLAIPETPVLAELLGESEALVSEAIGLLLAEERPIIQIINGVVQIPGYIQTRFSRGEISRWEFSAN